MAAPRSEGTLPPNLRPAEDPTKTCDNCRYMDTINGVCTKYNWGVNRTEVCDSWEADGD